MASQPISVPELAKRLGCNIPRAQALIRTGKIRGHKGARGWVTNQAAVEAYLAKRNEDPARDQKRLKDKLKHVP
jgi:excisionase family DNA binding protein